MKITHTFIRILKSAALITSFAGLLTVQGCFHDDDDKPVVVNPDQDASGLYKDGTASLDGGATTASDLIGFVHDNRFIVFSISAHLLIDGTMTAPVGNDFTATADIYENGVRTQTAITVTGQVTTASSLSATLSGTGLASGTINLLFDPLYTRGATFARIEATGFDAWGIAANNVTYSVDNSVGSLFVDSLGVYSGGNSQNPSCNYDNGVTTIPSDQINIFLLSNDVSDATNCAIIGTGYTGFGAVIDVSSADDTLLYAVTNGTNSVFAIFN